VRTDNIEESLRWIEEMHPSQSGGHQLTLHPDILVSLQISASQVAQLLKKKSDLARNIIQFLNTLRTGSFKLFKRPFLGFLTILTL
jgi:hypothetical protein